MRKSSIYKGVGTSIFKSEDEIENPLSLSRIDRPHRRPVPLLHHRLLHCDNLNEEVVNAPHYIEVHDLHIRYLYNTMLCLDFGNL